MKLSEIRPCDNCGGPIAPIFQVVRTSVALVNQKKVNQVLGMNQYFGGSALGLAEMFTPDPEVITVAMDDKEYRELMVDIFLCQSCHLQPVNLAELAEKIAQRAEAAKAKAAAEADEADE